MSRLTVAMITHYQSSGSLYLHSLFDGHPQVMSIPGVPHLDKIINGRFNSAQEALEVFNKANPKFYDTSKMTVSDLNSSGLYRLGKNADEGIVTDQVLFNHFFFECINDEDLTSKNVIYALYYGYAKSHEIDLNNKIVVLFHPHEIFRTVSMNNIFPGAKYIVTIRDPVRAYCSRLQLMKDKAKVRNIAHSHAGLLTDDAKNVQDLLQNNMSMRIVKIEGFAEDSQYILTKLCDYLGIDYNVNLEKSSFGSKLYWGANPNYKFNKFSKTRHVKPLLLKRHELLFFSIINKEMNKITGYPSIHLSWLEKKLTYLYLLLPFSEDIQMVKKIFFSNEYKGMLDYSGHHPFIMILKLVKERLVLLNIYIHSYRLKYNYNKIKDYLIDSEKRE